MRTWNLAGDRRTRAAMAAAMLAPLAVGTRTDDRVWQWSLLVIVVLAGWAILRTPTRRVVALAAIVLAFWTLAFAVTAAERGDEPTGPWRPTPPPGVQEEHGDNL